MAIEPAQWRIFFASLEEAESVSTALRKSKISRGLAYYYKKTDKTIAERWDDADKAGVDYLKDAATERAVHGVTSTHNSYYKGELVASHVETKYSDGLLKALLAARDPAFRSGNDSQVQARLTEELTRLLDLLQRKLAPELYQMVIEAIATGDDSTETSQETPRYITGNEA